jgi:hypothetical protein
MTFQYNAGSQEAFFATEGSFQVPIHTFFATRVLPVAKKDNFLKAAKKR